MPAESALIEKLRAALDERESKILIKAPEGMKIRYHADQLERLRTVAAHRKIIDRHGKGHWCISDEGGLGRMWWPSVAGACPDVRDLAAVYFPEAPDA